MALKTAHLAALTKLYEDFSARQKDPKAEVETFRVDPLSKALEKLRTDMDPALERAARRRPRDD
jgi:hypothetical protein